MNNKIKLLYNPFHAIAGWKAFCIGAVIVAISVVIAYSRSQYYEGALSLHFVNNAKLGYAFLSQILSLLCLVLPAYALGLIFSKGVRFQDVLGTLTLARYPYLIMAFFGFLMTNEDIAKIVDAVISGRTADIVGQLPILIFISFTTLIIAVWGISLYYNAFRVSTGIKGGKGIVLFIACLIFSELFFYIFRYFIFS